MRLTWRDGLATILVGGGAALYVAYLAEANVPLVSSPRMLAVVLPVLGIASCIAGSVSIADTKSRYTRWMGRTGGLLLLVGLLTLITGNEIALAVLAGLLVAMWLVTTVRHALTRLGLDDSSLPKLIDAEKKKMAHQ